MSAVSKEGKKILLNTIRIVEHQNKVKEEKKMWEMYKQRKTEEKLKEQSTRKERRKSGEKCKHKSKHKKDSKRKKKEKHRRESREEKKRNYWMKKLYDAKQEDDNKWKHSGFKELYPEEFESSSSDEEVIEVKRTKK